MGDLSDRMTGERNLPDYKGSPFHGPVRTVLVETTPPKLDLTLERVDTILAALKPAENPDDYFSEQPDPGSDRERQLIHRLLCWYWDENDTYDEVAVRVRRHVERVEGGDWIRLHPDLNEVVETLKRLDAPDRLRVIRGFCFHCGADDPKCQCWNDE
jgi:hypothetical protein